ncbi:MULTISPECIES: CPBP family intramembrane glutamic endopeptidase [unclassified Brevibacterium]|uniref:CPBP family intramembrane glutamic endopeptidase n=1 Tax=unclassified Brevibacterium TaxID=2614124 RepID=UPI002018042A|nr:MULTISPECIES: CPBP family intramembrane glutamic endopeptidase [unclassified Brevibacterium]MCM1011319.1 CPBP family intramembrane metalloprotease [Brevibacterium sp. XM4083]
MGRAIEHHESSATRPGENWRTDDDAPTDENGRTHDAERRFDDRRRPLDIVPARVPWPAVGVFVLVAGSLAWVACLPLWLSGKGLSDPVLVQLCGMAMMFTPLLATIAALIVQRRRHPKTRVRPKTEPNLHTEPHPEAPTGARPEAPTGSHPAAPAGTDSEATDPDTSAVGAGRLASIPRYLGLWPLYPVGRVLGMSGLAVIGIYAIVMAGYLVAAAFGWMDIDLLGLSGYRLAQQAIPGISTLPIVASVAVYLLLIVVNTGANVLFAFGEEVGWRGWLITSLRPLGTWPALIIIGVVWGLWHAPLILLGYNFARPDLLGLALMVGGCVMVGILLGWLRLRTGSVWPAVTAHAALNASAGMLLGLVIDASSPTPDPALVTTLGVAGWIFIAVVIIVLLATGQFRESRFPGIKPPRRNDPVKSQVAEAADPRGSQMR